MIKTAHIAAVFFFLCTIGAAKHIYTLTRDRERMQENYSIATAEKEGLKRYYKGQIALYETRPQQFTPAEFSALFQSLADSLSHELGLVRASLVAQIRATSRTDTVVIATDTTINKSTAKTWFFEAPTIKIRALEQGDQRRLSIRQSIDLTITRSLKRREGLLRKIFLIPLKRKGIYTVIPSDSSVRIEKFSVFEIE